MKLLLTADGFTTPEIVAACVELCGKPQADIRVAAICEGYKVERGDKRWVVDDLNNIVTNFPGFFDLIDLPTLGNPLLKERLDLADVIFVGGGHTDFAMHSFTSSGFDKLLPELLKTKVYIGSSAGGMIMGKRISTEAYHEVYGEEGTYGVERYMELVDFATKPHLDSPDFPKVRQPVLQRISQSFDARIYGLKNSQAIMVRDGQISFIGGRPLCVYKGKVMP